MPVVLPAQSCVNPNLFGIDQVHGRPRQEIFGVAGWPETASMNPAVTAVSEAMSHCISWIVASVASNPSAQYNKQPWPKLMPVH